VCKWNVVKDLAADICMSGEFLMQGFDRTCHESKLCLFSCLGKPCSGELQWVDVSICISGEGDGMM